MSSTTAPPRPANDGATAARLAQLQARRTGQRPAADSSSALDRLGRLQPGAAGSVGGAPQRGRRHAARGSRSKALALSVAASGGLSALFAVQASAHTTTSALPVSRAGAAGAASAGRSVPSTAAAATAAAPATAAPASAAAAPTAKTPAAAPAGTAPAATAAKPAAAPAASAASTFTGPAVRTRFGPVQVAITVAGGRLTDVQALATPTGGKSNRINQYAAPILRSEAIDAQSANIDTVSGATYTSDAYAQSLQAAIDDAVAQGVQVG